MGTLLGLSRNNCVDMTRIVRPHLDYSVCTVQAATSLLGKLGVSKEMFLYIFVSTNST